MTGPDQMSRRSEDRCLTIDDLYRYVALPPGEGHVSDLEPHLANCERCREELAEVLHLLHAEAEVSDDASELSEAEINQTLLLIQDAARKEERDRGSRPWIRWAVAAAAVLALLGAGAGIHKFFLLRQSNQYLEEAKASLESVYAAESVHGLRLDLPFHPAASTRAVTDPSTLNRAETLFSQSLVGDDAFPEANLGLAAAYMSESEFDLACDEFQKVLHVDGNHVQALIGLGVAEYEKARQAEDPDKRKALLSQALAQFDSVIKQQPGSAEAAYDRIWVLSEAGRSMEALAEIDKYLSREPNSIWAARLRNLQDQIR